MLWAKTEYIEDKNRWIIVLVEDECYEWFDWKDFGSRLPQGSLKFKKQMKEMGGEIISVVKHKKFGLLGMIMNAEVGSMSFPTEEMAIAALNEHVFPYFIAKKLASDKNGRCKI